MLSIHHAMLKMLKTEGKITDAVIENMLSWHHNGFKVYCGPAIWPHDGNALENLAHYVIREPLVCPAWHILPVIINRF
jgi:hypothetical protein